jgi:hypothetical protein
MATIPIPPSTPIRPPLTELKARLASALRDVDLVGRLIRAAEAVQLHNITIADHLVPAARRKGAGHE